MSTMSELRRPPARSPLARRGDQLSRPDASGSQPQHSADGIGSRSHCFARSRRMNTYMRVPLNVFAFRPP